MVICKDLSVSCCLSLPATALFLLWVVNFFDRFDHGWGCWRFGGGSRLFRFGLLFENVYTTKDLYGDWSNCGVDGFEEGLGSP